MGKKQKNTISLVFKSVAAQRSNVVVFAHKTNTFLTYFTCPHVSYYALLNPMFWFRRSAINRTVFGCHLVPAVDS